MRESGIGAVVFSEEEMNPRDTSVDSAGRLAREKACGLVIAVGGGSALDTANAAGFLATNPGSVREYDGSDKLHFQPVPVKAIPTTAETGIEVTGDMAITGRAKQ